MGGGEFVVSSSGRRRIILQDLITLRAQFAFFRKKVRDFDYIFESLFKVIETPLWNEESTRIFDELKEYGEKLQSLTGPDLYNT